MKEIFTKERMQKRLAEFVLVMAVIFVCLSFTPKSQSTPLDWFKKLPTISEIVDIDLGESLLSPIFESVSEYANSLVAELGEQLVSQIVNSFDPSYKAFSQIASGDGIDLSAEVDTSRDAIFGIPIIKNIVNAAKVIGLSLATIIFLINLMLILFGQAEQIKITLPRLILNYSLSMFMIACAETIMWEVLDTFSTIWTQVIMSSQGTELSFEHFGVILAILGGSCLIPQLLPLIVFIGIGILWKMFKGFIKLYMAIIEHYLIMIVLTLFFPAVIPTMITPNSSNMFKSYLRMIISQFISMALSVLMMSMFVSTLISGGWTAGIINYVAALAFLKVAQNIDNYMSKMGFDIVAGAGAFMGASKGAMSGLSGLLRTANMLNSGIKGINHDKMEASVNANNFEAFSSAAQKAPGGSKLTPEQIQRDFASEQQKRFNVHGAETYQTANGVTAMAQATNAHMPSSYISQMGRYGISQDSVSTVKQRNGNYEFYRGDKCLGVGVDGIFTPNVIDNTKYEPVGEHGAKYIGNSGGADESAIITETEVLEHIPGALSMRNVTMDDVPKGYIQDGMQKGRVDCGNGTYRDFTVAYQGSALKDNVPNSNQYDSFTSSHGVPIRLSYGTVMQDKPAPEPKVPKKTFEPKTPNPSPSRPGRTIPKKVPRQNDDI